jgi:hypothetical protein
VCHAGTSSGTPARNELSAGSSGAGGGENLLVLLLLLPSLLLLLSLGMMPVPLRGVRSPVLELRSCTESAVNVLTTPPSLQLLCTAVVTNHRPGCHSRQPDSCQSSSLPAICSRMLSGRQLSLQSSSSAATLPPPLIRSRTHAVPLSLLPLPLLPRLLLGLLSELPLGHGWAACPARAAVQGGATAVTSSSCAMLGSTHTPVRT